MEWNEVSPDQEDWSRQINITAYYGGIVVGSLVYCGEEIGWESVIDGSMEFMEAETEEQAKEEMIDKLCSHFESEINYFSELTEMLNELN